MKLTPKEITPKAASAALPLKYLSADTGKEWVSLEPPLKGESPENSSSSEESLSSFQKALNGVLLSENLIVLTGLGSSLCITGTDGKPLAPTMAALWEAAEAKSGDKFAQVKAHVNFDEDSKNIEYLLSRCLMSEKLRPNALITTFVTETENLIVEMCRFLKSGTELKVHEAFLRKVARRSTRLPRMKLFTTNYDVAFERAASASRFIVIDGFSHSVPRAFDGSYFGYDLVRRSADGEVPDFIPNVFHLLKLHGSLDWEKNGSEIIQNPDTAKPLIIYPRESKFETSYDQPFLEMMSSFQSALRQPNTGLLIIGFGFNDHHIAQPILSAIRANVGLKVMIVSPDLDTTPSESIAEIKSLITRGDSRLSLLATGFERLTENMPDLVAATESEIHQRRVKAGGKSK